MNRPPLYGLLLAAAAALLLSPDTLLMRWSGLSGFSMLAWRGLLTAAVLLGAWAVLSRTRGADLARFAGAAGIAVIASQFVNSALFSLAVAIAPVSVVLFGVATVPVFAALLSRFLMGEATRRATWIAMMAVLAGIAIAVFAGPGGQPTFDIPTVLGGLGGLGVAAALALTFVLLRRRPDLSILLAVGLGSLLSGLVGLAIAGPSALDGTLWPIAVSGAILLPVSFFALSHASRHTHASNVSLMLLLETVLGPLIVWGGTGEAPTAAMFLGGGAVIGTLGAYLFHTRRAHAARS